MGKEASQRIYKDYECSIGGEPASLSSTACLKRTAFSIHAVVLEKLGTQVGDFRQILGLYTTVSVILRGAILNRTYGTHNALYIILFLLLRGTIVNRTYGIHENL